MTKQMLIDRSVEIAKEYAKSGGSVPIDTFLEQVYKKLKELDRDSEQS